MNWLIDYGILDFSGRTMVSCEAYMMVFSVYIPLFWRWEKKRLHIIIYFGNLMVSFFALPLEVRLFIFISSLIIALDMVMLILFQNTSRNVLLCLTHVILKWKISWLNNIIVLTTDWWANYTSRIYHLYVKSMELFTIVIYRTLHKWMEELTVLYTPLFLWK